MTLLANTPKPPYYAVIFTSIRTEGNDGIDDGYNEMAGRMVELASQQVGFLGAESARNESGIKIGITVSYWTDLESIKKWKQNAEHLQAQKLGREKWYNAFKVRITKVERDYGFESL